MEIQGDSNFHDFRICKKDFQFPIQLKIHIFPLVGKNFSLDPSEWMIPC